MTEQEVLAEVRTRLGNPSENDLPDTAIESALKSALAEFSRHRPREEVRIIDIVPGQAEYELPDNLVGVRDVAIGLVGQSSRLPWDPYPDIEEFLNPSLLYMLKQQLGHFRLMYGYDWEVSENILRILPAPKSSGKLAYLGLFPRTLQQIPKRDFETFMLGVQGYTKRIWADRWNRKVQSVPTAQGRIEFNSGARFKEEGEQDLDRFRRELGVRASVSIVG